MDYLFLAIADMYGPHFLILYGIVIVATWVVSWRVLLASDPTMNLPMPRISENPGTYEMAHIRGGFNEVTRLAIFNLVQHGYLVERKRTKKLGRPLKKAGKKPRNTAKLPALERDVCEWFTSARSAREVFSSSKLRNRVAEHCQNYESWLEQKSFLCPPGRTRAGWLAAWQGSVVVLGLGVYKLCAALSKGRSNVGFMIIMAIGFVVIQRMICRPCRLSRLGKAYLKEVQSKYAHQRQYVAGNRPADSSPDHDLRLFFVGLYGVQVLKGTQYSHYYKMYSSGASASGGCGGSGCGGGCGGGGCGGGCGGCGGGGCGGCGD